MYKLVMPSLSAWYVAVQVHSLVTYMSTRGYTLIIKYYIATENFAMNFSSLLVVTLTFLSLLAHPHFVVEWNYVPYVYVYAPRVKYMQSMEESKTRMSWMSFNL